jgi:hypothetical protein
MKNKLFILFLFITAYTSFAQKKITWEDLSKVRFEQRYFPEYDHYFLHPYFSKSVKALEGKEVTITGYFLDIDSNNNMFVLSKGPMSSCFFCGVGGPETAIELNFPSKPSFKMDAIITVTGTVKLNDEDVRHFNYILTNVRGTLAD